MPAASVAFSRASNRVDRWSSCMVTSGLFMDLSQPLWNPMSRVAVAATCLALDIGFLSGYPCF